MNVQHLATLLESIATITWRAEPTGYAHDVASWAEYTGRSPEDARGFGWLEDIHPDDRERTSQVWTRATGSATQYRVEYRIRNREGRYRWFDVHGTPIVGEDGEVREWVGVCIDIHERVEAEERLRSVVNNMSEAFITIDRDWRITFQNQEGARINGKPPEAVLGKKMWEEWPEVLNSALERNYRAAMEDGRRRRFEHRYYDPGKYDVWLDVQAVPTGDGGLGIFYLDISQRKQAERQVMESERRFRQLAEHLQAAFLLTSGDGGAVVYASPFVQTLFGASPDELADDAGLLLSRVHPEDRPRVAAEAWGDPDGDAEVEYRVVDAEGEERWVYHRRTSVPGDDESEARVAHIITDVTERLQLERQLRQSQRMESLGRLAGGVAHDFNNVLTVILGRASMLYLRLQEEREDADWPEITEIEDAAARAAGITRQILAFARSEAGNPVDLDLNRVIQRSSSFFRSLLEESIEYVVLLEDGLPAVRMDPAQLDQVLVNLMVNASDAMDREGTLTVTTRVVTRDGEGALDGGPGDGRFVELSVQDTGEGIDPAIQEKIFDPFFSTKEDRGGSGLGLATCYGIVSAAGGTVEVESAPGRGATFRVLLPARDGVPEAGVVEETDADPRGTETILVVEDEARLRRMVRDVLQHLGYAVHTAGSGEEALERMAELGSVDLVVTDVVMPGMSGATLARHLLELDPAVPILTVSGYQAGEAPAESRTPRELAFLAKPFTPRELARRIRNILNHLAG